MAVMKVVDGVESILYDGWYVGYVHVGMLGIDLIKVDRVFRMDDTLHIVSDVPRSYYVATSLELAVMSAP